MSGVIYEDMIKPWLRISLSEVAASRVMKLTVLLMGTVCVTLVYLVEKLSGLIQVGIARTIDACRAFYSSYRAHVALSRSRFVVRLPKACRGSQRDRCSESLRWACFSRSQIPR